MTKLIGGLGVVILLLVGFYAFGGSFSSTEQRPDAISEYFQDQMTTLGVTDIGQPIEGFDADLLLSAFGGLKASDFDNVETLEGRYEVTNNNIAFIRTQEQPISSAERTVSSDGYGTLLGNLSTRLAMPKETETDVDAIITKIDISEYVSAGINEAASAFGVTVTPIEILEDSRCPIDVQCIQAGTVRVRGTLESGLGTANQEFELNKTITTESEEVTLMRVDPFAESTKEIQEGDYVFVFKIEKRSI